MLVGAVILDAVWRSVCDSIDVRDNTCTSVTGSLGSGEAILEGTIGGGTTGGGGGGSDGFVDPTPDICIGGNSITDATCPGVPGALTLTDVAAFRPDVGTNVMQPNGWAVVGLDTNFYSGGGADIVAGTLLGGPAEVRFTPVGWRWSYGDGATRSSSTGGNTWAALGIPEFDPTPTSHIYAAKGTYTITLVIDYAVEYRLGSGAWVPIAGVLSLASNPLTITVGSVKTVLVEDDCRANPSGPGC